jgi:hypothetical protein
MNLGEPVRVVEVEDEPMRFTLEPEREEETAAPVPEREPEPVPA